MITSGIGKIWTSLKIESSTIGPRNIPSVKNASFAAVGSNFCRNTTNATHALNESNEDTTDDAFDPEDDSSPDVQQDPTKDDWIDREDFFEEN